MALWELDEFQGPKFLGYVRGVPAPPAFQAQRFLPNLTIDDLAFEYIKGVRNKTVMAHVMGFDSEAPIAGRPGLGERVSGELPPIKRKAKFSEKEIIRFLQPRAGTSDKQTAINSVYDVTDGLLDAIQARVEWLRIKALSEPTVIYDEGGVIFEFDYGLDQDLQIDFTTGQDGTGTAVPGTTGAAWTDVENSNPLADLIALQDRYVAKTGTRIAELPMSSKAVALLQRNKALHALIRGEGAPATILMTDEIQSLFSMYQLPTISTYDVMLTKENADGTTTDELALADGKSFGVPAETVGNTLWGPTAESRSLIGTNVASQAPGIIAVTYATEEPPAEWVKAAAVAFPTMPDAHRLAQVKLYEPEGP